MFGDFLGFFDADQVLAAAVTITDGTGVPVDPASAPTFRIYDGAALLVTGVLAQLDSGAITGATDATPIVLTSAAHGLQTGNVVKVTNVGGNTSANGTATATRLSPDTFSVPQAGNGVYTSGGQWHVAGLYQLTQTLLSSLGFESGKSYQVLVNWNDGSNRVKELTFGVL